MLFNLKPEDTNKKGVYQIKNIINNKSYIGSTTVSFRKRYVNHRTRLRANKHDNKYLQKSWNKYGEGVFEFNLINILSNQDEIIKTETQYIEKYNSCDLKLGFNILEIAYSSLGYKHSKETKENLSLMRKGKPQHINTRNAIYNANKGSKRSDETKKKISSKVRGQKRPNEFCELIGKMKKGKSLKSKRKVFLLNNDYAIIEKFSTVEEASIKLNKSEVYIRNKCCNQSNHGEYLICYDYYPIINNRSTHKYKKILETDYLGNVINVWENCKELCLHYKLKESTVRGYITLKNKMINFKNKLTYIIN